MKNHYEPVAGYPYVFRKVIDEIDVFICSKGHKWEEIPGRFSNTPQPLNFPVPSGSDICPFCFGDFLSTLGRVTKGVRCLERDAGWKY